MNDYKEKIVGCWKNDKIEYKFESDGALSIYWVHANSQAQGNWSIWGDDEIIFNYGDVNTLPWNGKINYITNDELSITDEYNDVGSIDIMFRSNRISKIDFDAIILTLQQFDVEPKEVDVNTVSKLQKEDLPKKSLKEKVIDFTTSFFGIAFFVVIIVGFLYFFYTSFVRESHVIQSFTAGIIFLSISTFMIFHHLSDDIKVVKFTDNLFVVLVVAIITLPLLYVALQILFLVLTLWYFVICIVGIVCIVAIYNKKTLKKIYKFLIIMTLLLSLYFLYDAKGILTINFDVRFDNKKIENTNNS
ncbi:hypothetical protein FFWV33_02100 [Flavobacterium faecale]|uniref:Uncharacterized protein n=1 Tax=Flavobacterium faecale TaxID=1355330 RepID=A0A2S1L9K9_9FLAO|nr:hypothetical protein [Flavobacterium faecale]AWG20404.1 hypothetical protein FFWV33_02100 [Flavobacterium faecale]